jgi:hypothetical protein
MHAINEYIDHSLIACRQAGRQEQTIIIKTPKTERKVHPKNPLPFLSPPPSPKKKRKEKKIHT